MRHSFLLLLCILLSPKLFTQKVGIGTNSPQATLHINTDLTINGATPVISDISKDSNQINVANPSMIFTQSAIKGFSSNLMIPEAGDADLQLKYVDSFYMQSASFVTSFDKDGIKVLAVCARQNDLVCFYNINNPTNPILTDCVSQGIDGPTGLIYKQSGANRYVYVSSYENDRVVTFNVADLNNITFVSQNSNGINGPWTIISSNSTSSDYWVASNINNAIVGSNGVLASNVTGPRNMATWKITSGSNMADFIFAGVSGSSNILVLGREGSGSYTSGWITTGFLTPDELFVRDSVLYITYPNNDVMVAFKLSYHFPTSNFQATFVGGYSEFLDNPGALYVTADKTVLIASANSDMVNNYKGPGYIGSVSQNMDLPRSICEGNGYFYVASQLNGRVIILELVDGNRSVGLNHAGQLKSEPSVWQEQEVDKVYTNYTNVGIGVPNPAIGLNVDGTVNIDNAEQTTNNLNHGLIFGGLSTGEGIISPKSSGVGKLQFFTGHTSKMTIANGALGIGVDNPSYGLDVVGGITMNAVHLNTGSITNALRFGSNSGEGIGSKRTTGANTNQYGLDFYTAYARRMMIAQDGRVGIGTPDMNALEGKVKIMGFQSYDVGAQYGYLNKTAPHGIVSNAGSESYSLWASHRIAASEFNAYSDQRIKNIIRKSNNKSDLNTILNLKVTDYKLIDTISSGNKYVKKFIAQEVEEVLPHAVNKAKNFIPDIYSMLSLNDRTLSCASCQLKEGDKIKIILKDREAIAEVISANGNLYTLNLESANDELKDYEQIFVFGRQVDDYHSLDYNQIFSTSLSAIQQLIKENNEILQNTTKAEAFGKLLEKKIEELQAKVNLLTPKN